MGIDEDLHESGVILVILMAFSHVWDAIGNRNEASWNLVGGDFRSTRILPCGMWRRFPNSQSRVRVRPSLNCCSLSGVIPHGCDVSVTQRNQRQDIISRIILSTLVHHKAVSLAPAFEV